MWSDKNNKTETATTTATSSGHSKVPSIHINPNFKADALLKNINKATRELQQGILTEINPIKTHVNPKFLKRLEQQRKGAQPNIYVNPKFLQRKIIEGQHKSLLPGTETAEMYNPPNSLNNTFNMESTSVFSNLSVPSVGSELPTVSITSPNVSTLSLPNTYTHQQRKIISHTRTKLVREPLVSTGNVSCPEPMITINKRKLVRRKPLAECKQTPPVFPNANIKYWRAKYERQNVMNFPNLKKVLYSTKTKQQPNELAAKNDTKNPLTIANVNSTMKGCDSILFNKDLKMRYNYRLTKTHLNNAKHRSMVFLARNFFQSNLICPIYRTVGKCASYERGRCGKVHDPRCVAICARFLRNECNSATCLLSHNVCFSKMPVCKFYLQGLCVREDCVYLHKKVSDNEEICKDFLRGFCPLAEECNKRHEFINFRKVNSLYKKLDPRKQATCKQPQKLKKVMQLKQEGCENLAKQKRTNMTDTRDQKKTARYFENGPLPEDITFISSTRRKKLGELPSYIPL